MAHDARRPDGPLAKSPLLSEASYEQLAQMVSVRLSQDCKHAEQRLREIEVEEKVLDGKRAVLEDMEKKIVEMTGQFDDIVELNVGGQPMSTTRSVLCLAEGSLLAGMFSGNFDSGHKRDKEGRVFLDVDPPVFARVLSHLRLSRIATPECPAPLPHVPEDLKPEYDMLIKYLGLESFMYPVIANSGNIFQSIAELAGVCQGKLQTCDLVKITLSTTGGVPATNHEEVLGPTGFHERSMENSYGALPGVVTIRFLKHRVKVEAMELRAKLADIPAHMSNHWDFIHGTDYIGMNFAFSRQAVSTGRLPVPNFGRQYVDEVQWSFPRDFCLEHIVLHGRVISKTP
mmetsp:Transcript_95942/g.311144  ORF Transcript_95942/g.311144 Transcript_95942/m.311144 type:complete len:343 (+) Transcript_95942:96-1124(+)|eukprot:CAMPEP_0203872124 /NCGR_PEP_ID=MMETSP0359-20131031/19087_1 /ASSEMBLY_ACC=CAM_ASM_000338 /TAXON_ID=268821 /ORGANISM="Scrippsiella Hangoei, Strain SHTV-5" /LENGTH=342 /DNA_ID=CAMNT_0050790809 /DNA_START=91 /DNA_END=1119 /DNA_ORIENTATION=+